MRNVRGWGLAVVLCIAGLGCTDASVKLTEFADRTCACKDAECANKVISELAGFLKKNPKLRGDQQKATEAAKNLGNCAIKLGVEPKTLMETLNPGTK